MKRRPIPLIECWRCGNKRNPTESRCLNVACPEHLVKVRTYRIIRDHRGKGKDMWQKVIETGIAGYQAAKYRADILQQEEDAAHPTETSWTKDLFIPELEP